MSTRIDFGEDEYQHACGGAFEVQAQGRFSGLDFSPDGFSWDALDSDGTESWIVCTKCRARFSFGDWQDQALAYEAAREAGDAGEEGQA